MVFLQITLAVVFEVPPCTDSLFSDGISPVTLMTVATRAPLLIILSLYLISFSVGVTYDCLTVSIAGAYPVKLFFRGMRADALFS